jgi:hypothetical protein
MGALFAEGSGEIAAKSGISTLSRCKMGHGTAGRRASYLNVMAGLVPAIHVLCRIEKDVDARDI